jgi:TPR repeat protein
MSLTAAQFARAAAAEASHLRMIRLQRMSYHELQRLLRGDPAQAAVWIRSAAEYGVPAAQLRLGRMLLEGAGVALDQDAAFWWFRRAADQADAEAMNMVGRCHEHGWGTPLDLLGAAARYRASRRASSRLGPVQPGKPAIRRARGRARSWTGADLVSARLAPRSRTGDEPPRPLS